VSILSKLNEPETACVGIPIPVLLARIGKQAKRELGEALEPTGLKPRHVSALASLRDGPVSQAAVGEAAQVDSATLVGLLNELEVLGLVVRRRSSTDRRRHIVEISELGRARLAGVDRAVAGVESRFTAGLDAAQRAYLRALLSHIVAGTGADAATDAEGCDGPR
jgi:DNA-binding MarR family transcriptional regulator